MKQKLDRILPIEPRVAPRAGAWIETLCCGPRLGRRCVAPRAGAWIETPLMPVVGTESQVAPRAGAWIETC